MSDKISVRDAVALASSIIEDCDEIPEAGEDFAASVQEKVGSIMETIEELDRVSPNQIRALVNMQSGVARWLRTY